MRLKQRQASLIRTALIHDTESRDEELYNYFVTVVGLTPRKAKEYIVTRKVYLTHPAFINERGKTEA